MDSTALPPGRLHSVPAGTTIFRQGDPSIGLVLVITGVVELRRVSAAGQPLVLHRASAGETLAEAALFEPLHHCDAVATRATRLRIITEASLREAAGLDPELPWRLAAHLAHSLAAARGRLARLALPRAEDRLMEAMVAMPTQADGSRRPPAGWMRLAQEIGLAHETVYRALARMQRAGSIEKRGKGIWLKSR